MNLYSHDSRIQLLRTSLKSLLQVVEVMWLIWREEGQVVSTVRNSSVKHSHRVPEPGHREVRAHEERTKPHRPNIRQDVLNRVGVDWDYPSRGGPLVVDLVDVLVELWMVKEPVSKIIQANISWSHSGAGNVVWECQKLHNTAHICLHTKHNNPLLWTTPHTAGCILSPSPVPCSGDKIYLVLWEVG